jgi:photosystem II stability/assembly factor-like uncharacterized protein
MQASSSSLRRSGKLFPALVLILNLLLLAHSPARSQSHWSKLNIPIVGEITPVFLSENVGFIFSNISAQSIYRTTDGGTNWTDVFDLTGGPFIKQIYFVNSSHGYVAASGGIYETTDTGSTWKNIYPGKYFYSVYAAGNSVFAIGASTTVDYQLYTTTDDGQTWAVTSIKGSRDLQVMNPYVFGNKDSLVFTAITDSSGILQLWYSTNNGNDWQSNLLDTTTKGLFCFPHCNDILRTYLPYSTDQYPIVKSTDFGISWKILVPNAEVGAWIAGNSCAIYISNANYQVASHGVLRSTDQGQNWQQIAGPDFTEIDDGDFHNLSVVGNGAVVYAGDAAGDLWKTMVGGDSTILPQLLAPQFNLTFDKSVTDSNNVLNGMVCDTSHLSFILQNVGCNYMHLEKVSVVGLQTAEYTAVLKHHPYCSGLPDTLTLNFHPLISGTRVVTVHLHYTNDETYTLDTSLTLSFRVNSPPVAAVFFKSLRLGKTITDSLDYGKQSICIAAGKDTITLSNPSCYGVMINSIKLETDSVSGKDFSITELSPYFLTRLSSPNRIILDYHPILAGVKSGRIIIVTSIGTDTIQLHGEVIYDTAKLVIQKSDTINFGTKPFCLAGGVNTITLSNPSCYSVKIKAILFVPDPSSLYDFSMASNGPNILRYDALPHAITITFHPQTSGIKTAKIIIETDLKNDTVPVYANVIIDSRTVVTRSDTMQSPLCDSVDGFIHLTNQSCREMTLDAITIPTPFKLLPIRLPVIMLSGDSAEIPVRFIPVQHGNTTTKITATLSFYVPNGPEQFDTILSVTGFGENGRSSYILSANSIAFDSTHLCDSAKQQQFVIYSRGCDSLSISGISISGDSDFTASKFGSQKIASGDSININIILTPRSIGNKSARVTIRLQDSSVVVVPITGTVLKPVQLLYSDRSGTLDFGSHLLCESSDTLITLTNPGCDTVRVSNIPLMGSGFFVADSFPIVIPPGKSRTIDVKTILDTTGGAQTNSATLNIISDASNSINPVTLTKSYKYPHPVHLSLDATNSPISANSAWTMKIKTLPQEIADVNTFDFSLNYNTDLLEYLPGVSTLASSDGKVFHLSGTQLTPAADSSLGTIAFQTYITKDTSTTITLQNILFNASDPKFMYCAAVPETSGIDFILYSNGCGDWDVRRFIRGVPLKFSIHPNPVTDDIEMTIESPAEQDATIGIFSALGMRIKKIGTAMTTGTNTIHLDTKNLSGGVYLIRVSSANFSGSQTFVKVK